MDRTQVYLRVAVYIILYGLFVVVTAKLLVWIAGYFAGVIFSQFLAAIASGCSGPSCCSQSSRY